MPRLPNFLSNFAIAADDHERQTPVFRIPLNTAIMSEGEVEVQQPVNHLGLPKDVVQEIGSIKLFNKWSYEDVEIRDISLT